MQLQLPETPVHRSATFKETSFGIGDQRVIMDILRKRMYPQPIKAVCQEIMCNARDANREAGRGDQPIKVQLPSALDPHFIVSDNGLGITPERMANIFVLYGSSTKRKDNTQTGGFGLGAKTPFAYGDTFTITTTSDEADGVRRCRQYIAYIDESQLGALAEVPGSVKETTEPTGTSIVVAVRPNDFRTFRDWVAATAKWWTIKPIVAIEFKDLSQEVLLRGNKWFVLNHYYNYNSYVLVDGIQYPLNWDYADQNNQFNNTSLYIECDVGEVHVGANREELDYNAATVDFLNRRLQEIKVELKVIADKEVSTAPNLWDASLLWKNYRSNLSQLLNKIKPMWRGKELLDTINFQAFPLDDKVLDDRVSNHVSYSKASRHAVLDGGTIQSYYNYFALEANTKVVENDTGKAIDKGYLVSLFQNDSDLHVVHVIQFHNQNARQWFEDKFSWSDIGAIKMSTLPLLPVPVPAWQQAQATVSQTVPRVRPKGYKIVPVKYIDTKTRQLVNDTVKKVDDPVGGVYILKHRNHLWMPGGGTKIHIENAIEMFKWLGSTPYVILNGQRDKISLNWRSLDEALKEKVDADMATPQFKALIKLGNEHSVENEFAPQIYSDLLDHWWPVENAFTRWLEASAKVYGGISLWYNTQDAFRLAYPKASYPNPGTLMVTLREKAHKQFPLLTSLRCRHTTVTNLSGDIISYLESKGKRK